MKVLILDEDNQHNQILAFILQNKLGLTVDINTDHNKGEHSVALISYNVNREMVFKEMLKEGVPTIGICAGDNIDEVVKVMSLGVTDYIKKPVDTDKLLEIFAKLTDNNGLASVNGNAENPFAALIGHDSGLKNVVMQGKRAAVSDIPIFIQGESGTGKELIARAIHNGSSRKRSKFVAVNCGAIPENLVESTLFGHKKGSFTGAISDNPGKFREADGGTLFLDEVGELKPDVQVKLLRALQEHEIEPVGEVKPFKVDVRIISATNRDLEKEVARNNFRQDLFFRLNVFPVVMPPLRDRKQDIKDLAEHFIKKFAASESTEIKGITEKAISLLSSHNWKGNVRELENTLYRAVIMCNSALLDEEDIIMPYSSGAETFVNVPDFEDNYLDDETISMGHYLRLFDAKGEVRALDSIIWDAVQSTIEHYDGSVKDAARALKVGQSTIYKKLQENKK